MTAALMTGDPSPRPDSAPEWRWTDWLQIDGEVAFPLTRALSATKGGSKSAQFFLSILARF